MKTWVYQQVTEKAERKINALISEATLRQAMQPFEAEIHRQWAYGVYLGWLDLTNGWQNKEDNDRLLALTEKQS